MTNLINNLLVPLVTIVGFIVLMAMGKIDTAVAVPIISGLAGVHIGANVSQTTPPSVNKAE